MWPKLKPGNRVVRGPDWDYGTQDCDDNGNPTVGTILGAGGSLHWWSVKWDGGSTNGYEYCDDTHSIRLVGDSDTFEVSSLYERALLVLKEL